MNIFFVSIINRFIEPFSWNWKLFEIKIMTLIRPNIILWANIKSRASFFLNLNLLIFNCELIILNASWIRLNNRKIMIFRFHSLIVFEKILRFQNLKLFLPMSKSFKKVPLFLSFLINSNLWNLPRSYKRSCLLIKNIRLKIISRPRFQLVTIIYLLCLIWLICVTIEDFVLFKKK